MSAAIRPAVADDLEDLRLLVRETWHATYDAIHGAERVDAITSDWGSIEAMEARLDRAASRFLVAVEGGEVVGMAFAAEEEPGILTLHQLYVRPKAQRRGLGARLLAEIAGGFPHAGRLRLDVEAANRGAVAFYESQGFTVEGLEAETAAPHIVRMERTERR